MKKILIILSLVFPALLSVAQTYRAENAQYQGELSGGAVWLKEETDYVKFSVSATEAGNATIVVGVQAPYGDKQFNYQVGSKSGKAQTGEGTNEVSLGQFALAKGNNTILLTPNWTWFAVEYIRITGVGTTGGSGGQNEDIKPTGSFQVNGTELLDGNGKPFRPLGANLAYAWYKGYGFDRQFEAMHRAGANSVRVALSNGTKWDKDSYQTLQAMIAKAEQLKMVLIPEIHDATGSDSQSALQSAADWFIEMKNALIGHESTVIINIANEWMGSWNKHSDYANAYKTAIQSIRSAGLKHCLMVDAAGWGQEVSSLTDKAQEILQADPLKNIVFSVHMYGSAGAPGRATSNINMLLNRQIALCIGEFAWYHTDGDIDEDAIISTCKAKNVGWLAWSWWGNGSGLGYIDLVKNQYDENSYYTQTKDGQSCDWGKKVMDAWHSQAQTCTVYTEKATDLENLEDLENLDDLENLEIIGIYDARGYLISNSVSGLTLGSEAVFQRSGLYILLYKQNNKILTRKILIQ
ncbi:MAG: cellulase family glycosylhydrolase [Paludibacteraceae bacterium]|nr:cellulase family glycosylhydrolase [Paludibacteraceae bacterium]